MLIDIHDMMESTKLSISGVVDTFVFRSKSVGMMSPPIQEIPDRLVRSDCSILESSSARFDQCKTILPNCLMTYLSP